MSTYTFTFKKDEFKVEYITDNKESMERQFKIWVTCASVYTYNKAKIEKGLTVEPLPKAEKVKVVENPVLTEKSVRQEPVKETPVAEKSIEQESERIVREYKEEIASEQRRKEKDEIKKEFKSEVEKVVAKEEVVTDGLAGLYGGKTINTLLSPEDESEASASMRNKQDFDSILENTLSANVVEPEKKDERFLKVLKVKNVSQKLDYLIVTAYYLSEFERLDRFTLKQVNAKLMENISEFIDHPVLQEAIEKGLIELLPDLTGISSATEYRLTEAGEETFLNGCAQ